MGGAVAKRFDEWYSRQFKVSPEVGPFGLSAGVRITSERFAPAVLWSVCTRARVSSRASDARPDSLNPLEVRRAWVHRRAAREICVVGGNVPPPATATRPSRRKRVGATLQRILASAAEWEVIEKIPRFPKLKVMTMRYAHLAP